MFTEPTLLGPAPCGSLELGAVSCQSAQCGMLGGPPHFPQNPFTTWSGLSHFLLLEGAPSPKAETPTPREMPFALQEGLSLRDNGPLPETVPPVPRFICQSPPPLLPSPDAAQALHPHSEAFPLGLAPLYVSL